MKAYRITKEFADKTLGKVFIKDNKFNPFQDIKDDWFLSVEEVENCGNYRYIEDLKKLKLVEFKPKPFNLFGISKDKITDAKYKLKEVKPVDEKDINPIDEKEIIDKPLDVKIK